MKGLLDHLADYASYHRDRRNIATHFVGIPMIVVAVQGLFARPSLVLPALTLSPALLGTLAAAAYYLLLDRRYGLAMTGVLAISLWLGEQIAAQSTALWLTLSFGMFIVGWAFQFVGHFFEGKKPAFLDDLRGLLIGPLFVLAELGFALGLGSALHREIVRRAGPVRTGRLVDVQSEA